MARRSKLPQCTRTTSGKHFFTEWFVFKTKDKLVESPFEIFGVKLFTEKKRRIVDYRHPKCEVCGFVDDSTTDQKTWKW